MSEIPKAYEPQAVEDKWYQFWLDHSCFTADPARVSEKRPAYSIVIPPPNVTGMLHMGHVLNNTIQDILARKARMDGKEVLWLPGTDHAGIATEGMVSKQIWKEEKKSKRDIGREEFIKRVWTWKEKHGGIIIQQLKKLGCSCDWTRERFTMDPDYVRNVQRVFVDLYKKGLIYRGKRMVNWCPATQTALSDEEVEMKPQKGFMYHFKVEVAESGAMGSATVPVADSGVSPESSSCAGIPVGETPTGAGGTPALPGEDGKVRLTIATTRPETIPGDTAVAVNPKDPRYAHLIGKHIVRPLPPELPREQKLIPIIGDEHVDFEFGTGVLKVTPAHDKADFDIGQRHNLPLLDIMNPDATMNELAGVDLKGLDRFKARKVAVEKLTELGVLVEEKPYENNVGFSQRADVPIEPRLSEQWFLKYPSEGAAMSAVRGRDVITFRPAHWADVYVHWMFRIQDWCISRQLWWGHRIPVWTFQKNICLRDAYIALKLILEQAKVSPTELSDVAMLIDGKLVNPSIAELDTLIHSTDTTLDSFLGGGGRTIIVCTSVPSLQAVLDLQSFRQDPDVLDTWFSSWLWPFATMGWTGDKTADAQNPTLKTFYPTTDLVTGPDIIFFWVARMIMAGYEFMAPVCEQEADKLGLQGEEKKTFLFERALPFKNVYFTGIIRDKQGRKMSKSLGNSPDPLELIAKYGADALRFGTMRSAPLGQDVLFDEKDVELGRNFCNKLWNACRFRQMQAGGSTKPSEVQGEINPALLRSDDKWILLKLNQAIREITDALAEYKFSEATQTLYRFFWSEYCDWYVEASKAVLGRPPADATSSPLGGERAGVSGENKSDASHEVTTPTHPNPLPPALEGGEGEVMRVASANEAARANKLAVIDFVLSHTLRLFHPFLPFITEELWHSMGYSEDMPAGQGGQTIMNAPWPKPFDADFRDFYSLDDCYLESVNAKYETVTRGRNLRREANIPAGKKVSFVLKPARELPANDIEVLRLLLNAENFRTDADYQPAKGTPVAHTDLGELYLLLEGLVDVAAEIARLTKEAEKITGEIVKVEQKLVNPAFVQKVPPQVLAEHQKRLADWQAKLAQVRKTLADLSSS